MKEFPVVEECRGIACWQHAFPEFRVKAAVPAPAPLADIVNFGFLAPYLLVFEERERSMEEALAYAGEKGFLRIAEQFSTSVVFVYPTCDGGWDKADEGLFQALIANSRIHQYHRQGVVTSKDRFTGNWGDCFIRGAIFRTHLFARGKAADYVARCLMQTLQGEYLWGPGEITPATATLESLSRMPEVQRRDIPIVSVGNTEEVNAQLKDACDHLLVQDALDVPAAFDGFLRQYKRWCGVLETEKTMDEMGMMEEAGCETVPVSADNRGDDREMQEHRVGYMAYYRKGLLDRGPVPLVLAFHGGGDSALHIAHVSGWWRVAMRHGFLLVCVENHLNSTATEMMALLEKLKEKYPIDAARIYASGFSMGGIKTWDMYQEYPHVFAALAPMGATVEVGHNVYFGPTGKAINRDVPVPLFYSGGENSPLAELPFQAEKCRDRVEYVFRVNGVKKPYDVCFDSREQWEDPIYGVTGDRVEKKHDPSRGSVLTIHYFESEDGVERTAFTSVSGQGHECREHTCEQAWQFMRQFHR